MEPFQLYSIMNNRKLTTYFLSGALFLLAVIIFALINLFSGERDSEKGEQREYNGLQLYEAVPSDAVMVMHLNGCTPLFGLSDALRGRSCESVASLHYSAKNQVSPLFVIEQKGGEDSLFELIRGESSRVKRYNSADIYRSKDSLYFSPFSGILLASPSVYVLENSIRHLQNGTSILDNVDFRGIVGTGAEERLYINHSQIGKFFSGVVTGDMLKYSDFFLHFASWSALDIESSAISGGKRVKLSGSVLNNGEERFYSSLFSAMRPMQSYAATVLPATTAFAVALPLYSAESYLQGIRRFKAVRKELNSYDYILAKTAIEGKATPTAFADSLNIEEIVAAYCSFGGEYKWITLIRERESGSFASLFSGKESRPEVRPFEYKGYISSLYGGLFSNCNEESYCKYEGWTIIGPAPFVKSFARGAASAFTLEEYLLQSPARNLFSDEANLYVAADIKQLASPLQYIFKKEYASLIEKIAAKNNFEYLSVALAESNSSLKAEINLYGAGLEKLPSPKRSETPVVAESTIKVENGTFELKDFISGGKCYLEQLENLKLRYLNGEKKSLWTIPFNEPLCGFVEQIDFYNNGKLQMLFATGGKLYLLDRLGRIVSGFPVTFSTPVVLGPKVVRERHGLYTIAVIDAENTIMLYDVTQKRLEKPVEIRCGEFVSTLPELMVIEGEEYLLVKGLSEQKIYTMGGFEITGREKRRKIAVESTVEVLDNSRIKYKGTDGKSYIMDLNTGRSEKTE